MVSNRHHTENTLTHTSFRSKPKIRIFHKSQIKDLFLVESMSIFTRAAHLRIPTSPLEPLATTVAPCQQISVLPTSRIVDSYIQQYMQYILLLACLLMKLPADKQKASS